MNFLELIQKAGIVGCGGAGFPTHVKYNTTADWFIINAAECEPLLRTDRYLMINESDKLIIAAEQIGEHLGAKNIIIATKESYKKEIESLQKSIESLSSKVKIHEMTSFYPAGDEHVIVYEVTGNIIPPSGLPGNVGTVVSNVGTVVAVFDAMYGIPFTDKYLTITGDVAKPLVVKASIGTTLMECIQKAYPNKKNFDIIIGGPMMGKFRNFSDIQNEVVTKTTSGIIVLPDESYLKKRMEISVSTMLNKAKTACIQCSFCTDLCSRHMLGHPLKPHVIMRKMAFAGNIDEILYDNDINQVLLCSECGICEEYACPMGLQPRRINSLLKSLCRKEGIKYKKQNVIIEPNKMRDARKVPSHRLATRIGLNDYYETVIDTLEEIQPDKVEILLNQHVGSSATPIVSVGDVVVKGQTVAECADGGLGASLCASIDGIVTEINNSVVIERV